MRFRNWISNLLIGLCFILFSSEFCFAEDFALTTNGFLDGMAIPVVYTCDGKNVSPKLTWENPPAKTQTFALIVSDPDAPGGIFYHWVVFNIPKATKELAEGVDKLPAGSIVALNTAGTAKYVGSCPPKGDAHKYIFTLYALDGKLPLSANAKPEEVLSAIKQHTVGEAVLTGVYSRWRG